MRKRCSRKASTHFHSHRSSKTRFSAFSLSLSAGIEDATVAINMGFASNSYSIAVRYLLVSLDSGKILVHCVSQSKSVVSIKR